MPSPAPRTTAQGRAGQRRREAGPPRQQQRPPRELTHPHTAATVPEDRDAAAALLARFPLSPKRCKFVLALILKARNGGHQSKPKGVSHKTMAERSRFCFWLFEFLRQQPPGYKLDPRSFSGRHVALVTGHWLAEAQAGRLSPATLQTYFSFLKTFTTWIDKPKLLRPIERYFPDPALYRRSLASEEDKSWRARGVAVGRVIDEIAVYEPRAAASLRLMQAFQLRFKESVMFRPHRDVVDASQAAAIAPTRSPTDLAEAGHHLLIHRGTKGGRPRLFPVDTADRQAAIAQARQVVTATEESLGGPTLSLVQAMRRLRYCMERFGVTRADLGVVPHGLRHQGAADDYEALTGQAPPVAGGQPVDRATDMAARQRIASRLGHNRTAITSMYLGQSVSHNPPSPPMSDKC